MMAIWLRIKSGVYVALAFCAVLFGVWFNGRRAGTVSEQLQQKKDELAAEKKTTEQHVETRKEQHDVQDKINSLPPGDASKRLRDGWMRGENKD